MKERKGNVILIQNNGALSSLKYMDRGGSTWQALGEGGALFGYNRELNPNYKDQSDKPSLFRVSFSEILKA